MNTVLLTCHCHSRACSAPRAPGSRRHSWVCHKVLCLALLKYCWAKIIYEVIQLRLVFTFGRRSTHGFFQLNLVTECLHEVFLLKNPCLHRKQRPKISNLWSALTFKAIFKAKRAKNCTLLEQPKFGCSDEVPNSVFLTKFQIWLLWPSRVIKIRLSPFSSLRKLKSLWKFYQIWKKTRKWVKGFWVLGVWGCDPPFHQDEGNFCPLLLPALLTPPIFHNTAVLDLVCFQKVRQWDRRDQRDQFRGVRMLKCNTRRRLTLVLSDSLAHSHLRLAPLTLPMT